MSADRDRQRAGAGCTVLLRSCHAEVPTDLEAVRDRIWITAQEITS